MCYGSQEMDSMFRKKHTPHVHANPSWHTHASHIHTHDTMYANMYTYTHCGRKGYLAKFYFDILNSLDFTNKNVWVPIVANPMDPKRYEYHNLHLLCLM